MRLCLCSLLDDELVGAAWWLYCGVGFFFFSFSLLLFLYCLSLPCFLRGKGHWSCWSEYSACSVTCGGGGTKTRTRTCLREPGSGTESGACQGDATEVVPCNATLPCPSSSEYWGEEGVTHAWSCFIPPWSETYRWFGTTTKPEITDKSLLFHVLWFCNAKYIDEDQCAIQPFKLYRHKSGCTYVTRQVGTVPSC